MKRIILSLLVIVIVCCGLTVVRFGSALFQEGDPRPLLSSILRLKFSDGEYERFSESERRDRYVSDNTGITRYDVIKAFMNEKGWEYTEQMGSGLIFEKDDKTVIVETRQYSKHYILWNVPREV